MTQRPVLAVAALLLALTACKGDGGKPAAIDGVQTFSGLKHDHVKGAVTYPQTPPAGGPHNSIWLRCGVYGQPLPNENAVHSMEHGAVWITYRPDLAQADVDVVHRLQGLKPAWVLISPYPGLPHPVVASAWGLQLAVDKADDPRLAAFVKQYAGGSQGGEKGVRCDNGATLDQIARLGTPTPSPSAS